VPGTSLRRRHPRGQEEVLEPRSSSDTLDLAFFLEQRRLGDEEVPRLDDGVSVPKKKVPLATEVPCPSTTRDPVCSSREADLWHRAWHEMSSELLPVFWRPWNRIVAGTFFFRHMNAVIEAGNLIAQPPLFKVKKGKVEKYLMNDREFEDFFLTSWWRRRR